MWDPQTAELSPWREGLVQSCQAPNARFAGQRLSAVPGELLAMSDPMSMGIPAPKNMHWKGLSTQPTRCSSKRGRLLFIWCAGASTSPLQLLAKGGGGYISKDSWCMFSHMALHFRLFWQPNMIQQPISGLRLSFGRTTKDKQAVCRATAKLVQLAL